MIKNYLKIAWRNLVKNRASSIINIGGLAGWYDRCAADWFVGLGRTVI